MMSSSPLYAVTVVPLAERPSYVVGSESDPDDVFDVIAVGPPFQYIIPGFDVLAVELRQMHILGILDGNNKHSTCL